MDHTLLAVSTIAAAIAAVAGLLAVGMGYLTVREARSVSQSNQLHQRLRALQEVAQAWVRMDVAVNAPDSSSDPWEHQGRLAVALSAFLPQELPTCRELARWRGHVNHFPVLLEAANSEIRASFLEGREMLVEQHRRRRPWFSRLAS
ncbi:MAG TPA: hypothetical protein VG329_03435 [Candidatus Dormibacteraeota bacterium]|jgi:hypothetical protein|nr:hypothetical protein [Candidatus Dormibacteraeota bacterium]